MAVQTWIYGKPEVEYEGCVLDTYEHNGYDDSDWYAVCWDREQQKIVQVEYDTTRCGAGGRAEIDATVEVLMEVYRHFKRAATKDFDEIFNVANAKEIRVGDSVSVTRGRKIPVGTSGVVFWVGTSYNPYSRQNERRVGFMDENGEKRFVPYEYLQVNGWESRLVTGKNRKEIIRKKAICSMPPMYRRMFESNEAFIPA